MAFAASSARRSPRARRAARPRLDAPGRAAGASSSGATPVAPGPALEQAVVARDRRRPAGSRSLGGVLPTPAVALLAQDLGIVLSASHNPPEYNGVKFFDARGPQAVRRGRGGDRGPARDAAGRRRRLGRAGARTRSPATSSTSCEHFGSDLDGLRIAVDCANGAFSAIAPGVLRAARRAGDDGRGSARRRRTSTSAAARPISALLQDVVRAGEYDLGVAFDGDGDRMLAVDETRRGARRRPDPRRARPRPRRRRPSP